MKNEVKSSSINQTQAAKKSTLRVLPWSDHVESEVIESGQIKNPPNCVNVVNIDPEVSQNPLHYIPAPQRSLRMVKSMASIYCDLSMIGQNDYSFLNQPALDFSLGEIESEGKVVSKKVTLHDKTIDVNLFLKNDKPRNPLKEMERIDQSLILK